MPAYKQSLILVFVAKCMCLEERPFLCALVHLTLTMLSPDMSSFENRVDLDQLGSAGF